MSAKKCPGCGGDAGNNWFDRSFCPCEDDDLYGGVMHTRCAACGYALDGCGFESPRGAEGVSPSTASEGGSVG